jgi:hypothetical protein
MSSANEPEPRRHHYVPRCWLAGFTDTGENDARLWVTDLRRRKQWNTSPGNAGFCCSTSYGTLVLAWPKTGIIKSDAVGKPDCRRYDGVHVSCSPICPRK